MERVADPLPPHGFFPVSLNLVGRKCVVIGEPGDREAVEKDAALREVDADVRWITNPAELRDEDVADAFFVISTPQDEALSARLRALADRHKFLFCAIDQPLHGFVAMQAIVRAGPVKIGISTGGVAPRVGKIIKEALQHVMDAKFARFIECLGTQKVRGRTTMSERADRRAAIIGATDGFALDVRASYPEWYEDEVRAQLPAIEER
ncbi:precorrin-2 dehydrogenase/sirohydrochlorin ferrochelatase family protein [Vulcanimicrobium alpinum]|uniref:precorrin-2 dehydrogenase/sirohydrochlorin ferrochelatase family protein n=1 Tax=Vulcanimicrobium alpinum TaxID=3016050 RepID=UPI00295F032D|nr:NAD(P)-dependent oxidoreductase [Vulcanimicrobium alpinum]